jgi:hypothetical protein
MNRDGILDKVKIKMDEVTPPGVDLPFDDIIGPILDECAKDVARIAPLYLLTPISLVFKTTAKKITTSKATLYLAGTHAFTIGAVVTVSGITGTHTEYNGTFTLTDVAADSISYSLSHADETQVADTGGRVYSPMIYDLTGKKCYITYPSNYLRLYEIRFPSWPYSVREATRVGSIHSKMQENSTLESWTDAPCVIIKDTEPPGGILGKYLVCAKVSTQEIPIILYIKIPSPETLPDSLIDALSWITASKVLQISGLQENAKGAMDQYVLTMNNLLAELKQ